MLVDVEAGSAEDAVARAWAAAGRRVPDLAGVERDADVDGWTDIHRFAYRVPPASGRWLYAEARRAGSSWSVLLIEMSNAVAEKRYAQVQLVYERMPRGGRTESFAGRRANVLDDAGIAKLEAFVESVQREAAVPGVAVGVLQDGAIVFLGGFGVRRLGELAPVDADTRFMIASNTKALTTLMLAKLVDEGRIDWSTRAEDLLPSFALGDTATTAKVEVQHLVCACTGLPRQDFEWMLEFGAMTPDVAMQTLATMQPTSAFGELYQYSNPLAGAAGYIGGHVVHPELPLGEAYATAMDALVFEPLGMKSTTFDHAAAQRDNWAAPHAPRLDGTMAPAVHALNMSSRAWAPAGGGWSSARDLLSYVRLELAEGTLPDGERYIGADALTERRRARVASGPHAVYGMGLEVVTRNGVSIVHHGGDLVGYHSDMFWLPDHDVGAVVLTNGSPGWAIVEGFERKLLEVLFDGRDEAEASARAAISSHSGRITSTREAVDWPADEAVIATLAPRYFSDVLGEVRVRRDGPDVSLDFGEWRTAIATRSNTDGTMSLVGVSPGIDFIDLVVGDESGRRTLTVFDYQHTYVFRES